MKIKLIFDNWTKEHRIVNSAFYCLLSTGDFHSGTTFIGEIELDKEQEKELNGALKLNFRPRFILYGTE